MFHQILIANGGTGESQALATGNPASRAARGKLAAG